MPPKRVNETVVLILVGNQRSLNGVMDGVNSKALWGANQIVIAAADGCIAALAAAHYVEMKKASLACQTPAGALG